MVINYNTVERKMLIMTIKEILEEYKDKNISEIEYYKSYKDNYISRDYNLESVIEDFHEYYEVQDYILAGKEEYEGIFVESCASIDIDEWWDDESDGILLLLLKNERGIIPERDVWQTVENGNISEELIGEVCYFYSKKAKQYRWKARHLTRSNYVPEYEVGEKAKERLEELYDKKEKILSQFDPVCLHYDEEQKLLYAYYKIGNRTFHRPIDDCENLEDKNEILRKNKKEEWINLQIEQIGRLEVSDEEDYNMYCERFCEFALDKFLE